MKLITLLHLARLLKCGYIPPIPIHLHSVCYLSSHTYLCVSEIFFRKYVTEETRWHYCRSTLNCSNAFILVLHLIVHLESTKSGRRGSADDCRWNFGGVHI